MSQYVFLRLLEMRGTKKNLPIIDISGRILILLRRVQLTNLYNNSNFDIFDQQIRKISNLNKFSN